MDRSIPVPIVVQVQKMIVEWLKVVMVRHRHGIRKSRLLPAVAGSL
jgi:hypothetical protein